MGLRRDLNFGPWIEMGLIRAKWTEMGFEFDPNGIEIGLNRLDMTRAGKYRIEIGLYVGHMG